MCCKTSTQKRNCAIVGIVIGAILVVIGLLVQKYILMQIETGVNDLVVIPSPGDDGYEAFLNSDDSDNAPMYKTSYFYNLTNLEEVLYQNETPSFEEVGPYVWLKHERLYNVTYSDDGKEVHYNSWTWYTWEEELSMPGASPDDVFTTVWPTYLVAMDAAGSETNLQIAISGGIAGFTTQIYAGMVCFVVYGVDAHSPTDACWSEAFAQWGGLIGGLGGLLPADTSYSALLALIESSDADAGRFVSAIVAGGSQPEFAAFSASITHNNLKFDAVTSAALFGAGPSAFVCPLTGTLNGTPCSAVLIGLFFAAQAGDPTSIGTLAAMWPGIDNAHLGELVNYLMYTSGGVFEVYCATMGGVTSSAHKQFVYRTADQIMWYYEDPILILTGADSTNSAFFSTSNASSEADAYGLDPGQTGLITGKDDLANSKSYFEYAGYATLPSREDGPTSPGFWCDLALNVSGHSSEQFPPGKAGLYDYQYGWEKTDHLTLWSTQIIRQVDLDFKKETTFHGITVWEYGLSSEFLDPTNYPEFNNTDPEYATNKVAILNFVCPAGAAPIHITLPRFMDAEMPDEWKVDGVEQPDRSIHRTLLYADPITGATLLGSLRLQLNVLTPAPYATATEDKLIPVVWIEEHSEMTDDQAAAYQDSLLVFMQVQQAVLIVIPSFGGLLIIIFIVCTCHFQKRKKSDEHDTDGMLELN